ncbi:hypothetical protein B0T18DRAFT_37587 [Schizothecium vesticola]|uniref:Uncharacterized protein n=1 Tax=Schizothecium vesticola TaxID=314040 RepID=A0AA40FB15_9PEZI|nr:hypothetical protein B0T18DRAFT_37587 [Schizothecium vesticola]
MATYHSHSATRRRVLDPAGLEVLTDLDQHHITARAAPQAPLDWGSKVSPSTSRTGSWDSDVLGSSNSPDSWPLTEDHLHQVTPGHQQQKPAGCSYGGGDRSPVAALEERVRELQAVLVLLGKDLRDLEQTGCSCQDQASQLPSQGQSKSCSWCRTKSKLGIIRREISTRAKKAFGIPRKQDRAPVPDLATTLDIPASHNGIEPQPAVHKPCPTEELPGTGLFEIENTEVWRRWELDGSGSHPQMNVNRPTFAPHGSPGTTATGSLYTPGSSFSDGLRGPIRATPGRPSNQGSMVSTSSSSVQGSHSLVTPQSSRSNTSNSLPLSYTDPRTVISHNDLCESPTTLEPGMGMNDQQDVPPWGHKNAGLWASTSTLADDTGNGVNNIFSDHQWKGPTDRLYTADAGNIFDYPSIRGNEGQVDTELHGPPSITSFGTPQNTRNGSWDTHILELPCPSTLVFPPATTEAGVHSSWERKQVTPEVHGIRQQQIPPRKPLRSGTRADFEHLADGMSVKARFMSNPLNYLTTFSQPLMERNVAPTPSHFHTYPPIDPSVHFEPYEFGEAPGYPYKISRTPRPPRMQHTAMPQPLYHLLAAAATASASPRLPEQRGLAGNNRQSSLVGVGCKRCRITFTGKDPRKALKRHKESNKHRQRAGQAVAPRVLCPAPNADGVSLCGKKFSTSRRDNLGQHMRKDHGGLKLEDCGPVRYELEDEDEVKMSDA